MEVAVQRCPLCGSGQSEPRLQILARRMVRCRGCGLLYRNPRPKETGPSAPASLEERVGERRSHPFRRFFTHVGRPGRLLDVGCGYGFFLKRAQEAGWEAVGVDPDPRAVSYARERLQVHALHGELAAMGFSAGTFDLVTLWNVVEVVAEPVALFREVARVLKPRGMVFLRTQNAAWHEMGFRMGTILKAVGFRRLLEKRPYLLFIFNLNNFSRATLRLLLERTGFEVVTIQNSPPVPGDPYLGLPPRGERVMTAAKQLVHGLAQGVAWLSGKRWLLGPSLEAWGRRREGLV